MVILMGTILCRSLYPEKPERKPTIHPFLTTLDGAHCPGSKSG
jgi:hypothetical protein